jgi:hypothetical protein
MAVVAIAAFISLGTAGADERAPPRHHTDKIDEYHRRRNDNGNGIA